MATRAESLIRQFCHQRTLEVAGETKTARDKIPENVPLTKLPKDVQADIATVRHLTWRVNKIVKRLVTAGYHDYEIRRERSKLTNPQRADRLAAVAQQDSTRRLKINQLRDRAYVEIMGKGPAEAREIVERVQAELKQI